MILAPAWARRAVAFVRLGRPHFLTGGFVMHGLGVAAALYAGARLNPAALVAGQVAITATQWMVHYANDYFDLEADRANTSATAWSGGSRVLPDELLAPRAALLAALFLAAVAILAGLTLALVVRTGPLTLPLLAAALFLAWSYSAPPWRWHSRGLGELTTAIIVPVLTPLLGFYLQAGYLGSRLALALCPLFCLQIALQLSVNFPDAGADARVGKRTLVVFLGRRSAHLYLAALAAAYAGLPLLLAAGLPAVVAAATLLPAPLAAWLAWRVGRGGWAQARSWSAIAFGSIALLMLTAAAQALAFALPRLYLLAL